MQAYGSPRPEREMGKGGGLLKTARACRFKPPHLSPLPLARGEATKVTSTAANYCALKGRDADASVRQIFRNARPMLPSN
jgi:hypothetical protein